MAGAVPATHLGVNVLGHGQHDVVSVFSSKDPDKFARIDWRPGPHGSPLITGSAAMLEAEIQERFQAKTHTIFVCRVRHAEVDDEEPDGLQGREVLRRRQPGRVAGRVTLHRSIDASRPRHPR